MKRVPRLSELPDQMPAAAFWDVFGTHEHERLDFKAKPARLSESIAAMAMTDGGIVAIGVGDDRSLVGSTLGQKARDHVLDAGHKCGVEVQTREIEVGQSPVMLVAIPEVRGRIVTTPDGRLLRRVGSSCQPLVGDGLARFVRVREERSAEEEAAFDLRYADHFRLDLVNRALIADGKRKVSRQNVMRGLIDLEVAKTAEPPLDPVILRSAALLFAENPAISIPGATIQIVRREGVGPGVGPVSERAELLGPITDLLEQALSFIDRHTSFKEAVVGTHRERIPEYPRAVLREAVLNALAHRDYGLAGSTVDITIWDDRIEIQSPGSFPGHITLDNMRAEHYSRNRRLMRVLRLFGLVEEYGEGIDRMFQEMEERLMEPPHFVSTASSVTVALFNRSVLSIDDQVWLSLLGHLELSPQERRVLVHARHENGVTPRQLRQIFGDDVDTEALLRGARAKGLLARVGRGGGVRHVLSDEVVMRAGGSGVEARTRKRQSLLDEVRRRRSLSTAEAAMFLGEENRGFVKQLLDDLVRAGEVSPRGRTRARRYFSRR